MKKTKQLKGIFKVMVLILLTFSFGCKEEEIPTFTISGVNIIDDNYSWVGPLKLLYSVDDGATFSEDLPVDIPTGTMLLIKVNNGVQDLSSENFNFSWSGSPISPENASSDVAKFSVTENISSISVEVSDILVLITSDRKSGQFSSIDPATGETTFLFTIKVGAETLADIRAFTYHYNLQKFFVSETSVSIGDDTQKGKLYSVDIPTKEATVINPNDGNEGAYAVWDAIVDWVVSPDDSLMGYGDFNKDGNGIVKFGTDGGRSLKTLDIDDVCCGLGLIYDFEKKEFVIGNSNNSEDGEVIIDVINEAGVVSNKAKITNLIGFPEDLSTVWLTMKSMAQSEDGALYGILFGTEEPANGISYFVKIDTTALTVTYISTLGPNKQNQFNVLDFVPNYTL